MSSFAGRPAQDTMPAAEREMSRIVLALMVASAGCYSSYQVSADGDWEVRDHVEAPDARDDAGGHDDADGRDDADGDAEADLSAEAEAEADADADGDAEVFVEECPDSLPTDGPVRLNLRWRRLAATDWTDDGSAALGEASNVILAAFPRPSSPTGEPRLVRLAADSGEPLLDGPPLIPEYAAATALALTDQLLVGAVAMPDGPPNLGLRRARLESSGTISGDVATRGIVLSGATVVVDLRARADASWLYAATRGSRGAAWMLNAVTLPHSMSAEDAWPLYEDPSEPGAAFVAWEEGDEGDGVADTVAWTQPDGVEVRTATGTNLAAWTLPARSKFVPIAAVPVGEDNEPYMIAGRSDDAAVGIRMWVEVRRSSDLGFVSGTYLEHLESLVRRPEPRALERVGSQLVLAWAAERSLGDGEPVASCLYVTPLDATGAPAGGTMRIDPGVADAHLPGIEHVRLVVGPDGIYLLWRQDPELWVARVDSSS
jgi:hypothetical protein